MAVIHAKMVRTHESWPFTNKPILSPESKHISVQVAHLVQRRGAFDRCFNVANGRHAPFILKMFTIW